MAEYVERQRASGATPAELEATAKQMEPFKVLYRNPFFNAAITFLEPFPIGCAMSLITAAIVRRRPGSRVTAAVA